MKPLTVVTSYSPGPFYEETLSPLATSGLVEQVVIVAQERVRLNIPGCSVLDAGPLTSGETLNRILSGIQTKYFLLLPEFKQISIEPKTLERFLETAETTKASMVYSDFYDQIESQKSLHPLNDYQFGSIRDDFDFGAILLFSVTAIQKALKKCGPIAEVKFAGLYDLRLRVSIDHSIYHFQEPLYSIIRNVGAIHELPLQEKLFTYVDPRNRDAQKEMEIVFTDYLKRIGAYLPPNFKEIEKSKESFPLEASVIIPVRNRKETIEEAVRSALSQETDFSFNVIIVDNHSMDGTTAILSNLARKYSQLKYIIPQRNDLGIGGCWNEALQHKACGRYAVQLDSDDLYGSPYSLQKMVDRLRQGNYAMVIGSYTLVDSNLKEIPPGLIDHREWT
ncbi:MAG: glycosyltransferase family 2 protein, partial [Deltaproteobacteria bacterium]|nr:glycosyltransferase family 2 protein [Deltaproteobacteria bacterium]